MRDDYDDSWDQWAKTNPVHGGKMTVKQMAERIDQLEAVLRELLNMERLTTLQHNHQRDFAYIKPGYELAKALDRAADLVKLPDV